MNIFNDKFLFVWDLAQNHLGSLDKGLEIIKRIGDVCKEFPQFNYVFKFQYRQLDTLIHSDFKNRMDIKYIKRFLECQLTDSEFLQLKEEISKQGFLTAATPFDTDSVDKIEKQNFNILKIASVSLTDWPLLERVVKLNKPIILSTAFTSLSRISDVVDFMQHRNKNFALMHCRAEYPVIDSNLELNQIDLFKEEFPNIPIGFSSHEDPEHNWKLKQENTDSIKIAIAKGCKIFECHVDIDNLTRNKYSRNEVEVGVLLQSAVKAFEMCGIENERYEKSEKEEKDLSQFRRGIFAKKPIQKFTKLTNDNVFFAIPYTDNQLSANDWSKYLQYTLIKDIEGGAPIFCDDVEVFNKQQLIWQIYAQVKQFLLTSNVTIPEKFQIELSHHYGLQKFYEFGAAIITFFNREYAKKILVVLPNQQHPTHNHHLKEETFFVLKGELELSIYDGEKDNIYILKEGDHFTVERDMLHSFLSRTGCIFEEVSTTQHPNDSEYLDIEIMQNYNDRKSLVMFTK